VHGGSISSITNSSPGLIAELRRNQPLDLAHLPRKSPLIEAFTSASPDMPQVACFDTAFHRDMPRVACLLPIPRKYDATGLESFVAQRLRPEFG